MANSQAIGVAFSDQVILGGSVDNSPIGLTTPSTIEGTTVYADTELGYAAIAQGAVTQLTSKSTGVTLNKSAGKITMNGAALAAGTTVLFTLTNSTISANDVLIVNLGSAGTSGAYWPYVANVSAGTAVIGLYNNTAGSLSEAVVVNFAIIHGQ
jgi:hypothetical protein